MNPFIELSSEVSTAIKNDVPLVALESTAITNGLPKPHNLDTAISMENAIRANGAVPATIALMQGKIKVGLSNEELNIITNAEEVMKVGRRDLASALSRKRIGGTTISSTLYIANQVGIKTFATGGIGGIHRHWQTTLDISADLIELARTPITLVCSGVKIILDVANTLELLETLSVPVVGFGTAYFPLFYASSPEYPLDDRFDDVTALANYLKYHYAINEGGVLVGNPVPKANEIPYAQLEEAIMVAMNEANEHGITGKQITPTLLKALFKQTQGLSLAANIALLTNNAALGAKIAVSMVNQDN